MGPPSIYTPEGAYTYLIVVLAVTLLAAVAYLLLFTNAGFAP